MKTKEVLLRKRILGFSVLFHLSLIVAAMTTFYTVKSINKAVEMEQTNFIEIQFTNTSKSSGMGSTKKTLEKLPKEKPTARAIEDKTIKVEPLEEAESEVVVDNTKTKVSKNISDEDKNESSDTAGDSDEGQMLTGAALGSLDFDGEGVFGRKVIYHAPIKKIAEMDGKISINIAINRKGKVIGAAINKEKSTISDRDLLVKALKMILMYRFESDYSAPKIQYGKFTFIFDLKNN